VDTALDYLTQARAIQKEIGDRAGLCATLFNMGHIHLKKGEQKEAIKSAAIVGLCRSFLIPHCDRGCQRDQLAQV